MLLSVIRKSFTVVAVLLLCHSAFAQELSQVTFSNGSKFSYFSLLSDREVLIRISEDGKIIEWGTEVSSIRNNNYYSPKLQPYMGRVEYYGQEADSISRGRLKSIGTATITYYGAFETSFKTGKIKSIGSLQLDYYTQFDNQILQGRIKTIGSNAVDYYSSFENEAYRGNLKSIGPTSITYHSSFDDKLIRGKVKTIGSVSFTWYTSLDRGGYGGSLKSGLYRQKINTITYILQ